MKILLIHPFFYPHIGGSQRYAEELSVALMKKHPEIKIDVLCYNTDRVVVHEISRGLKIYRVPSLTILPGQFVLPCPIRLILKLWHLSKNNYDLVWTHIRFFDPCWWGWIYAKLIKAKSIFTGHCASHPVHPNPLICWTAKMVDLTIAKFSLRFYDQIHVTNQAAGEFFSKILGVKKYHLVYGGVDTDFFLPQRLSPRRLLGEVVTISFVGRLIESKGVNLLYTAAKNLLKKYPHLKFSFTGPGELKNELSHKINRDNSSNQISLLPPLNPLGVKDLLQKTDIFVHPSYHNEGLPNSILEAMACGCLVIATNVAGIKEIIQHKKNGLLISPKSLKSLTKALSWAITHPQEGKKMAQNARKLMVQKFDWEKIANEFYRLLSYPTDRDLTRGV